MPSACARRRPHHRRLRCPAAGRHRAEEGAGEIGRPVANSSRFASIGGSAAPRERAPRGDGFGEAHERDAERARRSCATRPRSGSVSDGNPCGITPTSRRPRLQTEEPDAAMPPPTATSGAGRMRPQPFHADQHRERRHAHGQRRQRRVGHMLSELEQVGEESLLAMWMPSSFGTWSSTITSRCRP